MAHPKRKTSKMKRRQRQAHNRYKGVQAPTAKNAELLLLPTPSAKNAVCTKVFRFSLLKPETLEGSSHNEDSR